MPEVEPNTSYVDLQWLLSLILLTLIIIQELGNSNEPLEHAGLRVSLGQQWPHDYKAMEFVTVIIPYFIEEETGPVSKSRGLWSQTQLQSVGGCLQSS